MPNVFNLVDPIQRQLAEEGIRPPPPPVSPITPPLGGKYPVPHYLTFSGIVNQISHAYHWQFDEALLESATNAKRMLRDPVIVGALRKRQIPVVQLEWHIEPVNPSNPDEMQAAVNIEGIIRDIPRFNYVKLQLLQAQWFGRYAVQLAYGWDYSRGYKRLVVKDHRPIMGDKMAFKWSGEVGVLVHPMFDGSWEPWELGRVHFFDANERQCVILHQFEPMDQDFFNFWTAGAVMGLGIRDRLYYIWWLKAKVISEMVNYMQRIALGFTIFYYEYGNDESLQECIALVKQYQSSNILLYPRKSGDDGPKIERVEPTNAGCEMFINLVTNYFDNIIQNYIVFGSLTYEAASTGLGSGVAEAHQSMQEMQIEYDATCLQETMTEDLVKVLYRWNHPGVLPGKFVFDVEKPNVEQYMAGVQMYFEMGGTIDGDDVRSVLGLPVPEPNHEILTKMAPEQPATVGQPAAGVPVEAQGGAGADQGQAEQGQDQGQAGQADQAAQLQGGGSQQAGAAPGGTGGVQGAMVRHSRTKSKSTPDGSRSTKLDKPVTPIKPFTEAMRQLARRLAQRKTNRRLLARSRDGMMTNGSINGSSNGSM